MTNNINEKAKIMNFKDYVQDTSTVNEANLSGATKKLNKIAGTVQDAMDKCEDALISWQEASEKDYPNELVKKYQKSLKDARMYYQMMEEYTRK